MLIYVIRHAETGIKKDDRNLYGKSGPPLNDLGVVQSQRLGLKLHELGIDPSNETVAVSEFLRATQTATNAGFVNLFQVPLLNEITTGLQPQELKLQIENQKLPQVILERAKMILDNPPKAKIWITHGLVIMGLRQILGVSGVVANDPPKAEVIKLNLP